MLSELSKLRHLPIRFLLAIQILALVESSSAETVTAKYAGSVDLDTFRCEMTRSSFVHRVCYDKESAALVVLLSSTYYKYCGVPASIAAGFTHAASAGRYFNANVKGRYTCE